MAKIEELKKNLEIKTSEDLFGIEPQPEHQCPKIDIIINQLKSTHDAIRRTVRDIKSMDEIEDAVKTVEDIDWEVGNIDMSIELNELRSKVDLIRHWGQSWKDIAKSLIEKLSEDDLFSLLSNDAQIKYTELEEVE